MHVSAQFYWKTVLFGAWPKISSKLVFKSFNKVGIELGQDTAVGNGSKNLLLGIPAINNSDDTFMQHLVNFSARLNLPRNVTMPLSLIPTGPPRDICF